MKENTHPQERSPESNIDSDKVTDPATLQSKLDQCDTLLDQLESDQTLKVSSKETPPKATAYPEFGMKTASVDRQGYRSTLRIRICQTDVSHSTLLQLKPGDILASQESTEHPVELLWLGKVIGTGRLRLQENEYVIDIEELNDFESGGIHYDI